MERIFCVSPVPARGAERIRCDPPEPADGSPGIFPGSPVPARDPPGVFWVSPAIFCVSPAPLRHSPAPASHPPGILRGEKRIPRFSSGTPRGCKRPARDPPPSRDDTGPDSCNGGRKARSSPPEGDSRFPDLRQELRSFAEATELAEAPRCSYQNRPNGPGEPSPGLRPEADALGRKHNKPKRPVGPRELCSPSSALSSLGSRGLSGRMAVRPAYPGHRPSASALGWALPARWAGFVRCSYPC